MDLTSKKCIPCSGGIPPMDDQGFGLTSDKKVDFGKLVKISLHLRGIVL